MAIADDQHGSAAFFDAWPKEPLYFVHHARSIVVEPRIHVTRIELKNAFSPQRFDLPLEHGTCDTADTHGETSYAGTALRRHGDNGSGLRRDNNLP
jgi:hypothetical protein